MRDGETHEHLPEQQQSELFYQAIGTVEGVLQQEGDDWTLLIGEESFEVWLKQKNKLLKQIQPGTLQRFRVYPRHSPRRGLYFTIIFVVPSEEPLGFTLKGCWTVPGYDDQLRRLIVHRNDRRSKIAKAKSVHLPLSWECAPEPDGQFWMLSAQLQERELGVNEAQGPYPPPLNWFQKEQQQSSTQTVEESPGDKAEGKFQHSVEQAASLSLAAPIDQPPLTVQEIRTMAIATKIQVTCKISEVPPYKTVEGRMEFFLAEGERVLTVRVKPKQFKKLTSHGYKQWVAAISGSLGPATETGFELVNASIQVFERKAKVTEDKVGKADEKVVDGFRKNSPTKPPDQVEKPPKKHRLIDSVRIG